jgi:hypothetical protein
MDNICRDISQQYPVWFMHNLPSISYVLLQ